LHKAYFEKGLSITSYAKYLIAFFGLASGDLFSTIILGLVYIPICYSIGWFWFKKEFAKAELEVTNRINPFVEEMRNSHK
jgi:hypothetical protein